MNILNIIELYAQKWLRREFRVMCFHHTHTQVEEVECLEGKGSKTVNTSQTKKNRNCQDMGRQTPAVEGASGRWVALCRGSAESGSRLQRPSVKAETDRAWRKLPKAGFPWKKGREPAGGAQQAEQGRGGVSSLS